MSRKTKSFHPGLHWFAFGILFCLALFAFPALAPAQEENKEAAKPDVPSGEELDRAQKLAQKVLPEAFGRVKPDEMAAMSNLLWRRAMEPDQSPAEVYVLLDQSLLLATNAGEPRQVSRALRSLDSRFKVDAYEKVNFAANGMRRSLRTPEQHEAMIDFCMEWSDRAVEEEDYMDAARFLQTAQASVRMTRNPALTRMLTSRINEVGELRREFSRIEEDMQVLKDKPDDPRANLQVGKYLALYRGEWDKGLPMLAKGSEQRLADLAKAELSIKKDAESLIAMGDQWAEAAAGESGLVGNAMRERANHWYRQALPKVAGLERSALREKMQAAEVIEWGDLKLLPGAAAQFFVERKFEGRSINRTLSDLEMDWGQGSPTRGIGVDNFAVRIRTFIKPPKAGKYELEFFMDDLADVWLNGEKLALVRGRCTMPVELYEGFNELRVDYEERGHIARLIIRCKNEQMKDHEPLAKPFLFHSIEDAEGIVIDE